MSTDHSDDQLGARLDSALRANLESDEVDVDRLLTGSRRRAGRIRTRRISVVAAVAVLLVGVPAGVEVFRPGDGVGPAAVLLGSAGVPSGFGLRSSELPAGLVLATDRESSAFPAVPGLICGPPDRQEEAGRQWLWRDSGAGGSGLSVRLTVTRWKAAGAVAYFTKLAGGSGCTFSGSQVLVPFTAGAGAGAAGRTGLVDETWSASSDESGQGSYGRAAVRVGDWITGVEVHDPGPAADAAALAQKLALAQVNRYVGHVRRTQ